jgi:hypothetical protein
MPPTLPVGVRLQFGMPSGFTSESCPASPGTVSGFTSDSPSGINRNPHSELELAPGLKGVAVANMSEIPAIIDRVIEVVNSGHFDVQMKQISENFASKKKSKGDQSASVQHAA